MANAKISQVVDKKLVSGGDETVLTQVETPRAVTVFGLDFMVRKMDKFHRDAKELRANKVDASLQAILLGADGRVLGQSGFVHYGQPKFKDGAVELVPVNPLSRHHSTIRSNLQGLPVEVERIVLIASVHEAAKRKHHIGIFGSLTLWLAQDGDKDPMSVNVFQDFGFGNGAVVLGEAFRSEGQWRFRPQGEIVEKGLDALCEQYGVEVRGA